MFIVFFLVVGARSCDSLSRSQIQLFNDELGMAKIRFELIARGSGSNYSIQDLPF